MLNMDQYDYIRLARRVYNLSIKKIAKDTGHSRNTVRKVLRGEKQGYAERKSQPYPVLGKHIEIIDAWLEEDKTKPIKQRHTARRVFTRLQEEHQYQGSEGTIRNYVRLVKRRLGLGPGSVFIPGEPAIGREAEIDWGTAEVEIGGNKQTIHFFCMRSKYSGKHFVRCYQGERQQLLFDAHLHAFAFFGGVFPVLIYDNMTTAVRKVYQGRKRDLTENYRHFHSYYNFEARFCNRGAGHEKGGVEGQIGYTRRNYFVPVPKVESLEALNAWLIDRCQAYGGHRIEGRERTVQEYFEEERDHLLSLPEQPFSNVEKICAKVDKYATVIVDKNRYSVPCQYGHCHVTVVAGADQIMIYHGQKKIATHIRQYGSNKWQLDPYHYFELLKQRPQAFETARPIVDSRRSWPTCLEKLLKHSCEKQGKSKGTKDFITVLELYQGHASSDIEAAVELALEKGVSSSEVIKHLLVHSLKPACSCERVPNWPCQSSPDVKIYGMLGGIQ